MARLAPSGQDLDGLIHECLAGNQSAGDALFTYLKPMIAPVLSRLRLRADDQGEVRSRTWLRLYRAFQAGRPDDRSNRSIVAYARVIAGREALTYLEYRNLRDQTLAKGGGKPSDDPGPDVPDTAPSPEHQLLVKEAIKFIGQCEPVDQFICFMKFKGCSTAQIQYDLRLPPYEKQMSANAIDLRYHKIMKRLKEHFDGT